MNRHQRLIVAVFVAVALMPAAVFAFQSIASNPQSNKKDTTAFSVAQTPASPATLPGDSSEFRPYQVAQATPTPPPAPPPAATPAPPSLVVGGVDVGKQVTDSLTSLRSILEGVTDVASAQAASRQLQNVIAQIERYDVLFPQLSVEQRTAFAGIVNAQMPAINQLFDKVLSIPNVAQVLQPTIDSLKPKLATIQAAPSVIVGGVDIGKQLSDTLSSLRSILEGITDVATAQAALPQLQGVITQIEKIDNLFLQLSGEQRAVLTSIVNAQMPTINQLFDKVLAIPGVAAVLKPTIDSLRPKLALLQTTTSGGVVEIVLKGDTDNCIRPRRGQKPDPSCCVEKLRLVSGTAQFTTNTGNVGNLTEVNTVACISPGGDISYWKSEESILGFDVAIAGQVPGAPPGAAPAAAPGAAPGAPPGAIPSVPPATPVSPPGGGAIVPPFIPPPVIPPTPPPCVPTASVTCP